MSIWIVYAGVGSGHKVCAAAVKEYFPQARMLDCLDYCPAWVRAAVVYGYNNIVRYVPWIWALVFYFAEWTAPLLRGLLRPLYRKVFRSFIQTLHIDKPTTVISTHFFTTELCAFSKKTYPFTLMSVVTDFGVHRFWLEPLSDYYICASRYTKELLIRGGVPRQKIIADGLPLRKGFSQALDRSSLAKKYNVTDASSCVLISASNIDTRFIQKIIEGLYRQASLLVITGNNKALKAGIQKMRDPRVQAIESTPYMWELMSIADCIVTKAGGMTSFECWAMRKSPVFIQAHPGQEYTNAAILTHVVGFGKWAHSASSAIAAVMEYLRGDTRAKPEIEYPRPERTMEQLSAHVR